MIIRDDRFFCEYDHEEYPNCNSFFTPNGEQFNINKWSPLCPSCGDSEQVTVHGARLNDTSMIAIEAPIPEEDEITKRVNEFIEQESAFSSKNSTLNPWDDVDATDWYLHKRLRLGFKLDEPSGPQAWLFSLAEIAESSRWVSGGRESLSADTNWCIDGPFFLHPNRNELDDRSRSSIFANVVLLKNVLSILVGRLVSYFHRNGLKIPVNTPFDDMILAQLDGKLSTEFGNIIQAKLDPTEKYPSLIPYHKLFGGRGFFVDASGNLINPNKAKRIPDEWLLNDGQNQVSLSEWISDNADLSNWIDFPVGSVDGTPKLLQVSDAPVLAHVQK